VPPHIAADQDGVPWSHTLRRDNQRGLNEAQSRGVDEQAVALALSTTLVSPVMIWTPQRCAASRMAQTTRQSVSIGNPSSMMNALDKYNGRAPLMARSFTVP